MKPEVTTNIFQALEYGKVLANAEIWKKTGAASAALTGFLAALYAIAHALGWISTDISVETIASVSSILVFFVSMFQAYLQYATTAKIGLRAAEDKNDGRSTYG